MIYGYNAWENYRGDEIYLGKMNRKNFERFLKGRKAKDSDIKEFLDGIVPGDKGRETLYFKANWTVDANAFEVVRYADESTDEFCPFCESEVRISADKISYCPECGRSLLPCSAYNCSEYCDWTEAKDCFMFQRNKTHKRHDEKIERSTKNVVQS
jgi:hypothetical protein